MPTDSARKKQFPSPATSISRSCLSLSCLFNAVFLRWAVAASIWETVSAALMMAAAQHERRRLRKIVVLVNDGDDAVGGVGVASRPDDIDDVATDEVGFASRYADEVEGNTITAAGGRDGRVDVVEDVATEDAGGTGSRTVDADGAIWSAVVGGPPDPPLTRFLVALRVSLPQWAQRVRNHLWLPAG